MSLNGNFFSNLRSPAKRTSSIHMSSAAAGLRDDARARSDKPLGVILVSRFFHFKPYITIWLHRDD